MNAPVSFSAPPPALVVISGGPAASQPATQAAPNKDAAFQRLHKALPAARRVLEIGCGQGELAQAYRQRHADVHWVGVDHATALADAGSGFDLIVINRLEHLPHAAAVLADLAPRLQTGGTLILRAENHARLSTIAHLIEADLSTGIAADAHDAATMDLAHPRAHSHATLFKLLMDAGWMPSLVESEPDEPLDDRVGAAAR